MKMEDEIYNGNTIISKFMGYQILNKKYQTREWCSSNESTWVNDEGNIVCDINGHEIDDENNEPYLEFGDIPFNSSWNLLMTVLDKISNTKNETIYHVGWALCADAISLSSYDHDANLTSFTEVGQSDEKLINITWKAIVNFINYYNETN